MPYALLAQGAVFLLSCCSQEKPVDQFMESIFESMRVNNHLYKQALVGLSEEELHRRPSTNSSSMLFVAGHMAGSRCLIAELAGLECENPWKRLFRRGSSMKAPSNYPSVVEVVSLWDNVTSMLKSGLAEVTVSKLAEPCPVDFPFRNKSTLGGIAFLFYHETYHIGQMGYLRKWLGHESLVG